MQSRALWSVVVLFVGLVGCDDEQGAPAKCRTFAREACAAIIDCGLADESDMSECRADIEAEAECDDAVRVAPSYGRCLDDINDRRQCAAWPDLPASCQGVIEVR